jgi:hypothetical protein
MASVSGSKNPFTSEEETQSSNSPPEGEASAPKNGVHNKPHEGKQLDQPDTLVPLPQAQDILTDKSFYAASPSLELHMS